MRESVKHLHFVGIGGIGMSGIAEVLLDLDYDVSGSELIESTTVKRLRVAGAKVYIGHNSTNIKGCDALVTSSAISPDNPEIIAAQKQKIPIVPRAEMLGELMRFRKGIAIAGTHGKTTTTSLVASVLASAGLDPTFVVGGVVNSIRTNARLGRGEYLIAEADESDASFLHLQPQLAVVTNIDADHMETYDGDFTKLCQTYIEFLHNLPFYGLAVLCFDDPEIRQLVPYLRKPWLSYGFTVDVDFRAVEINQQGSCCHFKVTKQEQNIGKFTLNMPGRHNVLNALAAIAIANKLGVKTELIQMGLAQFEGIGRRFERLGEINIGNAKVELVDDYAHHPKEIEATVLAALECWPNRRLVIIFQPHRYSRTRDLFDDFAVLLSTFDALIVTEVYAAGEAPITGADGRSLCRAIRKRGHDPLFAKSSDQLAHLIPRLVQDGDVLLTLGAGDIGRFAQAMPHNLNVQCSG